MADKKYLELYQKEKKKIISGEYRANERLPSKRVAADKAGCSTVTVEAAYRRLADEGFITPRERSGYYVNAATDFYAPSETVPVSPLVLLEDENSGEKTDFEYSVWFKTIRKVIADNGERLFEKSPNKGCAVLRNAISEYLLRYRSMLAQPESIIIGSGSEQLYESVIRILGMDKVFGIEDPSYRQIEAVYTAAGVKTVKLKMGADGIESSYLEKTDMDVLHVTPFHSYPSGVTASFSKRCEYLGWAKKNSGYIVEDDFESEFFMPGNPIESLYSIDKHQRVIYMNTFSKSLSPSMRMGYMILSEELMKIYDEKLGHNSCTVPVLDQYVLAEFITSGSFERHLNRTRRKMRRTEKDL